MIANIIPLSCSFVCYIAQGTLKPSATYYEPTLASSILRIGNEESEGAPSLIQDYNRAISRNIHKVQEDELLVFLASS